MKKKILGIVLSVSIVLSLFVGMGITPVSATTIPLSSGRVAYESFEYKTDASAKNFFTASNEGETTVTQAIVNTGKNSTKALAVTMNMPNSWNKADCQSSEITFSSDVAGIKLWYNLNQQFANFRLGLKNASTGEWTNIMFEGTADAGATVAAGAYEKEIYFYSYYGTEFDYTSKYVLAFEATYADGATNADYVLTVDDFVFIKALSTENFDDKEVGSYNYFSGAVKGTNKDSNSSDGVTVSQSIVAEGGANNTKALQIKVEHPNWGWMNFKSAYLTVPSGATGFHAWYKISTDLTKFRLQLRNNGMWSTTALVGASTGLPVQAGTYDHSCFAGSWKNYNSGSLVNSDLNLTVLGLEIDGGLSGKPTIDILIDNIMFVKAETYQDFNSLTDANFFTVNKVNTSTVSQAITTDVKESGKALAVNMKMSSKYDRVNLVSKALDIPYNASAISVWYNLDKAVSNFRFGLKNITTGEWTNVMFVDGVATAGTETKTLYFSGSNVTLGNNYALAIEAFGTNGVTEDYIITIDNIIFYTGNSLMNTNSAIAYDFETNDGFMSFGYNSDGASLEQATIDGIGESGTKGRKLTFGTNKGWANLTSNQSFKIPSNAIGMRIWYNLSTDAKLRIKFKSGGQWVDNTALVESTEITTAGVHSATLTFPSGVVNNSYNLGIELTSYNYSSQNPLSIVIDNISFIYSKTDVPTNNFDNATSGNYFTEGNINGTAYGSTCQQTYVDNAGMYGSRALKVTVGGGKAWISVQTKNFTIPQNAVGMHMWFSVSADCPKFRLEMRHDGLWTDMIFAGGMESSKSIEKGTYDKTIYFNDTFKKYDGNYYTINTKGATVCLGLEVDQIAGIEGGSVDIIIDSIEFIYGVGSTPATTAQFNAFKSDIASLNDFDHEDYLNNDSLTAYNTVYTLANSIPQSAVVNSTLNEIKAELATAKSAIVMKAEQQAPVAPALTKRTSTKLTLSEVAGCEYSIDGTNWAAELSYADLTTGETYKVYQRVSRTDTHLASPASTLDVKLYAAGDVNNDESVNATDLLALKKHLLGIEKAQDEVFDNFAANANEDEDGTIDIRDLVKIKKITSGEVA